MSAEYSKKKLSSSEKLFLFISESEVDSELLQSIEKSDFLAKSKKKIGELNRAIDLANENAKLGEFDKALAYLILVKKSLQNEDFPDSKEKNQLIARLLHAYGAIQMQKGKLDEAHNIFIQMLKIKKKGKFETLSSSSILINLGIICWHKGRYEDALRYYHQALKSLKRPVNNEMVSSVFNNIAIVYEQQGELEKALRFYQKSLELLNEKGSKFQEGAILQNMGNIYRLQGKTKHSLRYLEDSLEIFKGLKHNTAIATVYESLGQYYRMRGMLQKSLRYFQKSKDLFTEERNEPLLCHVLFQMISIEIELGNKEHAIRYLKRLNWLLRKATSPSLLLKQKIAEVLYDLRFGKPQQQVEHAHKLIRLLNDKSIDVETKIFIFAQGINQLLLHCDSEKNPEGFRQISNLVDDFLLYVSSQGLDFAKPVALYFRAKVLSLSNSNEEAIELLRQSIALSSKMQQRKNQILAKNLLQQILKDYEGKKKFRPIRVSNTIHSVPRLNILLYLYQFERASFGDLRQAVGLTAGNLSSHCQILEKENLIQRTQGFTYGKPSVILEITPLGKEKLREYAQSIEDLLRRLH